MLIAAFIAVLVLLVLMFLPTKIGHVR